MIIQNKIPQRLLELLDKAEKLAGQFTGGYSNNFLSAQEFHTTLADSINKLNAGDTDQLNYLWLWFAPTCDWDEFAVLIDNIFKIVFSDSLKTVSWKNEKE